MTSEEDMIKFHNGDTLDSIPVIREIPRQSGTSITDRQLWVTALTVALVSGAVTGLALGLHSNAGDKHATAAAPSVVPVSSSPVQPSPDAQPTVTATATVTASPTDQVPSVGTQAAADQVHVIKAPYTGGDPATNYCFAYTGSNSGDGVDAVLLADAPGYECQDFLFSTHPKDDVGVFEQTPPDCSATPRARSARVVFDETSEWGFSVMYTCLLPNNGA